MIAYAANATDSRMIRLIIARVRGLLKEMPEVKATLPQADEGYGSEADKIDWLGLEMDLTVAHLNGCPMDLNGLLDSANFNLVHDVFGIRQHINRQSGKLEGLFVPRYAKSNHLSMEKLP